MLISLNLGRASYCSQLNILRSVFYRQAECLGHTHQLPSQLTFVRHRKVPMRKQSFLPRAKTKLFILPEKIKLPDDVQEQLLELEGNYKAAMDSIMAYCAEENKKIELKELSGNKEEEFAMILAINREENERTRMIRESVLAKELAAEEKALREKYRIEQQWLSAKKEEVENIVKYEKEQSVHFLNLDSLEQAISDAIDNPVSYDFAIDLDGQIHREDTANFQGSPYWTDDVPREHLKIPPSQEPVKYVKRRRAINAEGRWF